MDCIKFKSSLYLRIRMVHDKYDLNDLNELEPSMGDKIYSLLQNIRSNNYFSTREDIVSLLENEGIETKEVFIEKGLASGLILEVALSKAAYNCEMADRLALI